MLILKQLYKAKIFLQTSIELFYFDKLSSKTGNSFQSRKSENEILLGSVLAP